MTASGEITARLAGMLAGRAGGAEQEQAPAPTGFGEARVGRSPAGRLRNFRAMSDGKLAATLAAAEAEGNDPEALAALREEVGRR